jgi:hypothetical protein
MSGRQALVVADFVEPEDEVEDDFTEVQDFASFLREAQALSPDAQGARDALDLLRRAAAVAKDFTNMEIDLLLRTIADHIRVGRKPIREAWKVMLAKTEEWGRQAAAAARAAADAREAEEAKRRQEEERAKMWASCGALAENPKLLDEMETVVHKLGLVGEGPRGARRLFDVRQPTAHQEFGAPAAAGFDRVRQEFPGRGGAAAHSR